MFSTTWSFQLESLVIFLNPDDREPSPYILLLLLKKNFNSRFSTVFHQRFSGSVTPVKVPVNQSHCSPGRTQCKKTIIFPSRLSSPASTETVLGRTCKRFREHSVLVTLQDGISTGPENENVKDTVIQLLHSFYQFSRPHTVIGTVSFMFLHFIDIQLMFLIERGHYTWAKFRSFSSLFFLCLQLIGITLVSLLPVETISDLPPTFLWGCWR